MKETILSFNPSIDLYEGKFVQHTHTTATLNELFNDPSRLWLFLGERLNTHQLRHTMSPDAFLGDLRVNYAQGVTHNNWSITFDEENKLYELDLKGTIIWFVDVTSELKDIFGQAKPMTNEIVNLTELTNQGYWWFTQASNMLKGAGYPEIASDMFKQYRAVEKKEKASKCTPADLVRYFMDRFKIATQFVQFEFEAEGAR